MTTSFVRLTTRNNHGDINCILNAHNVMYYLIWLNRFSIYSENFQTGARLGSSLECTYNTVLVPDITMYIDNKMLTFVTRFH